MAICKDELNELVLLNGPVSCPPYRSTAYDPSPIWLDSTLPSRQPYLKDNIGLKAVLDFTMRDKMAFIFIFMELFLYLFYIWWGSC